MSAITTCANCGNGIADQDLLLCSPWNVGIGDQREPLGLKWAARYFANAARHLQPRGVARFRGSS